MPRLDQESTNGPSTESRTGNGIDISQGHITKHNFALKGLHPTSDGIKITRGFIGTSELIVQEIPFRIHIGHQLHGTSVTIDRFTEILGGKDIPLALQALSDFPIVQRRAITQGDLTGQ